MGGRTLELDVTVDYHLLVKIPHRSYQLSENPLQQRWREQLSMRRSNIEEIPSSRVRQDQYGPSGLDIEGLEIHQRRVMYDLQDLELALQAHLNPLLTGAASGPVLANLNGDERLPVRLRLRIRHLRIALQWLDLTRRQHDLTERPLSERLELPPPPPFAVVSIKGLEQLQAAGLLRTAQL